MEKFTKELETGEIHQRDKWQFELKSEFFTHAKWKNNIYTQEIYLFIPNSLHVNEEFYSKQEFYQDETNFIRYKTPEFTLKELIDPGNKKSPLNRIATFSQQSPKIESRLIVEEELKLFGNIFRSSLRKQVRAIIHHLDDPPSPERDNEIFREISLFCSELTKLRRIFLEMEDNFLQLWTSLKEQSLFHYMDEFLSDTLNYYLIGLLDRLLNSNLSNKNAVNEAICFVLGEEKAHRTTLLNTFKSTIAEEKKNEYILYRSGLLNKFVIDALLLHTTRASVVARFRNIIGSIAAGVAMFFFFSLFVSQGSVLILNSTPFILLTVFLYIVKDRIKEWLQMLSYRQFAKWFSDYKTEIFSPDGKTSLGVMKEYVSFIKEKELSKDLLTIRNREFHVVLESFKRPEKVLYYKRKIILNPAKKKSNLRRHALNIIFRFNVRRFLEKADDPQQDYLTFDPDQKTFFHSTLPKVYHLNIILKNTFMEKSGLKIIELKKYRLILDKNGIKRVEHFPHH